MRRGRATSRKEAGSVTRRPRAAVMLEFIFVFPMALVIVMFAFDVARVYMTMNATQYAAASAVRAGAVYGAAGIQGDCEDAQTTQTARSDAKVLDTFCQKLSTLPGGALVRSSIKSVSISPSGTYTRFPGECSSTAERVAVDVKLTVPSIVPGLAAVMGVASTGSSGWTITVHEEARCEIEVAR